MNSNQKALELFEQSEYEKALELFRQAVGESRNIQSLNNLAWIYSYEEEDDHKALVLIKEADDFAGDIEVADLYVELGCFNEAIQWFEKGWKEYWKTPDWVSRFVYALLK